MFVYIGMLLVSFIHCIISYFKLVTVPPSLITLTWGFIWGIIIAIHPEAQELTPLIYFPPRQLLTLYTTVIIFRSAFSLDPISVRKCIFPLLLISIPICLLTCTITGVIIRYLINIDWKVEYGILLGMMLGPTYPLFIVTTINTIATKTKSTDILLEGESIIATALVAMVNILFLLHLIGCTVRWYQFVCLLLRFIVMGAFWGYIWGKIGTCAIRNVYDDTFSVVSILSSIPFITYCLAANYLNSNGTVAVSIAGMIMNNDRPLLSKKMDARITELWKTLNAIFQFIACSYIGIKVVLILSAHKIPWHYSLVAVVLYILYFCVRFCCFVIFLPLLRLFGLDMDFRNMLLCVWGGIKNPISLIFIEMDRVLLKKFKNVKDKENNSIDAMFDVMFFHVTFVLLLSYLINGTLASLLLRLLGLTEISRSRQINMINCMKHIFEKREHVIAMLKMDRFLANTNWSSVYAATTLRHPFRTKFETKDDETETTLGIRETTCPDCKKELVSQPTLKELNEMKREAHLRILKARKVSYTRQYESGMISKEGVGILNQAVEAAIDSYVVVDINDLQKKFLHENIFTKFIKKRVNKLEAYKGTNIIRPPRNPCRRSCYYVVTNGMFDYYMYVVVIFNMIPIIVDTVYHTPWIYKSIHTVELFYTLTGINTLFYLLYLVEFFMKILGFSWLYIYQGCVIYFGSVWNVLDFVILCSATIDIFVQYIRISTTNIRLEMTNYSLWLACGIMEIVRYFRILRLLRVCSVLYTVIIKSLYRSANMKLEIMYELGKTYAAGESEVLELLPFIIDHIGIREEMRRTIEDNRLGMIKLLGLVQKERPLIAITVKTKQAIRTILSSMKEANNQVKLLGWTNDFEHTLLVKEVGRLYREVNALKFVEPSAPKVIFKEVPWMAGDEQIIDFLFDHVTVKKFEPNDVVLNQGDIASGIYIVVTGLLKLSYHPNEDVLTAMEENGLLPIVDYIFSSQYDEHVVDYIVSGNCVGELSTLTGRPYNCKITAVTHTQVYVLSQNIIQQAMEISSNPINGLECRIWKAESIRIAIPILLSVPAYHSYRQEQIKYTLERAFVPNLADFEIFVITSVIQDIILIQGIVADYNTKEILSAPCYIARTVQRLILPRSSLMNIQVQVETKLLIIPEVNMDEIDVMLMAEETSVMVPNSSVTLCLKQIVHNRAWRLKKLKENENTTMRKRRISNETVL